MKSPPGSRFAINMKVPNANVYDKKGLNSSQSGDESGTQIDKEPV